MKIERFCGYCYPHKRTKAIGDIEGSPACRKHWKQLSKGTSSFRYTVPSKPRKP
jgi:hypothetical protein